MGETSKRPGVTTGQIQKAVYSITKTPAGYGMKVMSVAKNITKTANIEAEP